MKTKKSAAKAKRRPPFEEPIKLKMMCAHYADPKTPCQRCTREGCALCALCTWCNN